VRRLGTARFIGGAPLVIALAAAISIAVAACGSSTPSLEPTSASTDHAIPSAAPTSAGAVTPSSAASGTSQAPGRSAAPVVASPPHFVVTLDPRQLPIATTRSVAFANGSAIILAGGLTSAGTTGSLLRIPIGTGPISSGGGLPQARSSVARCSSSAAA
jgi:hypothetical protein